MVPGEAECQLTIAWGVGGGGGGGGDSASTKHAYSVQYKELKLGSHSGHAKTNLSGHCVKMSGHYFSYANFEVHDLV